MFSNYVKQAMFLLKKKKSKCMCIHTSIGNIRKICQLEEGFWVMG